MKELNQINVMLGRLQEVQQANRELVKRGPGTHVPADLAHVARGIAAIEMRKGA